MFAVEFKLMLLKWIVPRGSFFFEVLGSFEDWKNPPLFLRYTSGLELVPALDSYLKLVSGLIPYAWTIICQSNIYFLASSPNFLFRS